MQSEKAFIHFWDDYAIPEKSPHQLRDIAEHAFMAGRQSTAAPELLAAVNLLLAHAPYWIANNKNGEKQIDRDAIAAARAAIAKATGQ